MKKKLIILFSATFFTFTIMNCQKNDEDSAVVNKLEKAVPDWRSRVQQDGLADHDRLQGEGGLPTPLVWNNFILKLTFTNGVKPANHFLIKKDVNLEPFKTINQYYNQIDGIFLGIGRTSSIFGGFDHLIVGLSYVTTVPTSSTCNSVRQKLFKVNNEPIFFKCTDRDLGTWVRMASNDPILAAYNANKKGIFIGKSNLYDNIYRSPNTYKMYFYIGYDSTFKPQYVVVDKTYFTNTIDGVPNPNFGKRPTNYQFFSSYGSGQPDCIEALSFNHGGVRPCPDFCAE